MSIVRRIVNLFRRSKLDREIEAELRSHIEMRMADNIAAGMSAEKARRDALLRFGNPAVLKERVATVDIHALLDSLWRDLHYAARQLRRSPGFAVTAVLTLALGIAANVVVFGVLNALVLNAAIAPQSSRLYEIVQKRQGDDYQSYPDYADYRRLNTTFTEIAAYRLTGAGLSTGHRAVKCWFSEASGDYFDLLGAKAELGHFFDSGDENGPNSAPYVVLSDHFWHAFFNADPRVIGTEVAINKHPFTIIGIAQPSFHGPDVFIWPDLWVPMLNERQIEGWSFLTNRSSHGLYMIGKLKPGVSPQQATSNLNSVAAQLARENPSADEDLGARLVAPGWMGDQIGDPARAFLFAIMCLAFLTLLAVCVNLASIFAARTADRSRELAIRLAIGGGRSRMIRQLLTESVTVSHIGGLAGTLFAAALLRLVSGWQPFAALPVHVAVVPGGRVYAMALLLSIGSGLLFGLLPMRQVWQTSPMQVLKGGAGRVVFRRLSPRDILLAVQIALCTLLVTASLVAFRGIEQSLRAPLGFQPRGVTLASTDLHMAGYTSDASLPVQQRMLREVSRMPGVTAVGTINPLPLGPGGDTGMVFREGTTDFRPSNAAFSARYFWVSPGYLPAAGTRLLAGRDISWRDDTQSPRVVLVNRTFARRMFPNSSSVGRRFTTGARHVLEIVGVVEEGKYVSLTENPKPAIFVPLAQSPSSEMTLVVRSHLTTAELAPDLARVLAGIDPNIPFTIQSCANALGPVLFPARAATASLGIMGLLAAMLAVTGIFGMGAYSVSKRMKELGVRVALGAQPVRLMTSALGRPLILLGFGSAAGLGLGVAASRLLAQIVYQATPRDPFVLGGAVATMLVLGLLALWIPARRALRIHPARLLREE